MDQIAVTREAWVFINKPNRPKGYLKGEFLDHTHLIGEVRDGKEWVEEKALQIMAQELFDTHIFYFVDLVTTTDVTI